MEVNFIGKVESFEADFEALCRHIGVGPLQRVNENVTGELADPAGQQYRYAARMSRASISKINALFQQDFELFGYTKVPC